jgi:hypothetical protein
MEKINTNVVGLLLAKEIIGGGFIPVDLDIYLNTKYLSKENYEKRIEKLKKLLIEQRSMKLLTKYDLDLIFELIDEVIKK